MKPGKLIAFIILLPTVFLAGCNEVEMQSQRTALLTISGSHSDWPEKPQYFEEKSRMLVSVMNDDYNLYIRLSTRSQTTKMMFLRGGFTVWLDHAGGSIKKFGVQFPIARQRPMPGNMQDYKPRNSMEDMLEDSQYSLAILDGSGETRQTMSTVKAEDIGIYARLGMEQGHLVYELKVPLGASESNKIIGVGFESGKISRGSGKGKSGGGGGGRGGGRGSGGGGGGGKKGGKGGGQGGSGPQPIELWIKVHLAQDVPANDSGIIEETGKKLPENMPQNH